MSSIDDFLKEWDDAEPPSQKEDAEPEEAASSEETAVQTPDEEFVAEEFVAEQSSLEVIIGDDPIERLEPRQVQAALRMIQFPGASMQSVADSVGVSRQTIYNWKKNEDFNAFITSRQQDLVSKTISSRAKRNAVVYDKVHEEFLKRLEGPASSEAELKAILGNNYTQAELHAYRQRFISNASLKDTFAIWTALEEKTRKDAEMLGSGEDDETILHRIQMKYAEYKLKKIESEKFSETSGFTYDVDFNEVPSESLYQASEQVEEDSEHEQSTDDTNFLDMFAAEN